MRPGQCSAVSMLSTAQLAELSTSLSEISREIYIEDRLAEDPDFDVESCKLAVEMFKHGFGNFHKESISK